MSSSSIICVLCRNRLVNKCDKNLVDARKNTVFNARQELLSLDIKVEINSTHICRNCLTLLDKRRALLKNLGEVNNKIHDTVKSSTSDFILPVSLSATPELSCIEARANLMGSLRSELHWRISDHQQISDTLVTCCQIQSNVYRQLLQLPAKA